MRVTALVDREAVNLRDPQFRGGGKALSRWMPFSVIQALRTVGHEVAVVPLHGDVLAEIDAALPELVFNLTERMGGDRRRAPHISSLLDILGLPYTGASAAGQVLSNDKAISKEIARGLGVPVPHFEVLPVGETRLRRRLAFPVIVKPRYGEGSEGITLAALAQSGEEAGRKARRIHETMQQDAIVETFVDGRELAVGLLGNRKLVAFPIRETLYGRWRPGLPRFNTSQLKNSESIRRRYGIRSVPADLPAAQARQILAWSRCVFRALELRDYARIDLRLGRNGSVAFIEANCNCDLRPGAFGLIASWAGYSYERLIDRIARLAYRRRGAPLRLCASRPLFG